ncbi:MAG TPA: DUF2070 family protein [Methanocorpusculum sp.]|nr:DUF2070 family protein [Methanocorpusculum sp.]
MKIKIRDLKLENLTKYLFRAPPWWLSIIYIAVIGGIFELVAFFNAGIPQLFGTAIAVPQILAVFTTKLFTIRCASTFTWNRSGLLSLAATLFTLPLLLLAFIPGFNLLFAYIIAAGLTLSLRMVVLTAVVDYRVGHIAVAAVFPAVFQTIFVLLSGNLMQVLAPMLVSLGLFSLGTLGFLRIFDKPLKRGIGLNAMQFVNVYISNLTDGSSSMEGYLEKISELVTVPETTFFFRRSGKKDVWFVVPNLHPGPMSNIGGSNFPNILFNTFKDEATVFVSHGCASHDLNLISNNETVKIATAIRESKQMAEQSPSFYQANVSAPIRIQSGSVSLLSQKFGDSLLIVTTRSPEMTEDLDYSIGRIVMGEAKSRYAEVGFVDGHNCMTDENKIIYPSTKMGNEFITGASAVLEKMEHSEMFSLEVGVSHVELPYTHAQGFGDTGLIVFVVKAGLTKTAYVLFDGNNVEGGVRDILWNAVLQKGFDECEIMTTDSHIVNAFSGRNPIGHEIPVADILPYVFKGLDEAMADLSPAEVGAASGECMDVQVFGPGKITQLTSLVSSIVTTFFPFYGLYALTSGLVTAVVWMFL